MTHIRSSRESKLSKCEHISQSTQIETRHIFGVHVQPDQKMNTHEVR